jgi:type VI protein secretion system component VasA
MSVFHTHATPSFSVVRVGLLVAVLTVAGVVLSRGFTVRTATIADTLPEATPTATATVFPEPLAVEWEGYVTRTLVGGQGIEVRSRQVPGGYFFAYSEEGFPASISEAPLKVLGRWLGISCEYGRCAPEVQVDSWAPLPIELE